MHHRARAKIPLHDFQQVFRLKHIANHDRQGVVLCQRDSCGVHHLYIVS